MENNVYFYMSVAQWLFGIIANVAMVVMAFAAVVLAYKFKKA